MRYYNFTLGTNGEQIKEKAKVNLKEYSYDGPIAALNGYMGKNMENNVYFFAYREDENTVDAAFSFNEQKMTFQDAYSHVLSLLSDDFCINRVTAEPVEVTMYRYRDDLLEARRRGYKYYSQGFVDVQNIWIQDGYSFHYDHEERIIPDTSGHDQTIYDPGFAAELANIDAHSDAPGLKGNMVHYVISARSMEAAADLAGRLMQRLYGSKRISSRRMEMISNIEPDFYKHKENHFEDFIENNYGGAVVIDLSEKFGYDPTDYVMTSRYIERLVKKYRNHCLFVFTYNMDHPGFSYQLLPRLAKYVIPVVLREGRGNRRAAVQYMRSLIGSSEYAQYAGQAGEFMKLFQGKNFSQTDVLDAYERFESWCINKNILKAYDYDISGDFMLERDKGEDSAYDKLNRLIGLDIVKKQIDSIISTDIVDKERKKRKGKDYQSGSMHMIFSGNPGSAKTTVAKLFAGIAKERGILKSGAFVERGGMDLCGLGCVGAIREAFLAAKGGVLFIDEAYSMASDTAVAVLIQEMENHRDEVIVIMAGYNDRMKDFIKINEGLKSRIPHWIDFPDYTADELTDIFRLMISERGFSVTDDVVKEARYIFEKVRNTEDFGNGRYVRNLIDRAVQNQAVRLLADGSNAECISKGSLFRIVRDDICMLGEGLKKERDAGEAAKELDDMIGLSFVKQIIHKAIAYYKLRKLCMDKGIARDKALMHMVFTGNPGTAKTTVARLFAEILKDEKVLSTGVFIEVGRADLVGDHVGSTAPLVKKKFREAQGGVLFIDEAYSLCDSYREGFGDEAINTLVQEMENHRDDVIVIFAGYPGPMKEFLERNPGMKSRIAFQVSFDDYDTDELCEITKLMVEKKQMTITDSALDNLRLIYDNARTEEDYGNGRFVRGIIEEAEMNLAERIMKLKESEITADLISTIEDCDIQSHEVNKHKKLERIGFAV